MALIVEDGSLVTGADSYVSLSDAQQYATDRGLDVTLTEGLLLRAVDYINAFRKVFKGLKLTEADKDMQWPRRDVVIDGYLLGQDIIPECVVKAQIQTAVEIQQGFDPLETVTNQVLKREKIDVLEFEYDTDRESSGGTEGFVFRKVRSLLRPVLMDTFGLASR